MSQNLWATIMPFGPVTNILLAQNFFFVLALISGTEVGQEAYNFFIPITHQKPLDH
jgi:hypothetical protein